MLLEYVQSVTGTYELIIYIQFIPNHLRLCSRTHPCGNFVMALARPQPGKTGPQLGYKGRTKPQIKRLTRPEPTSWPSLAPTWHRSFCES